MESNMQQLPIRDELDLHLFKPSEVGDLIPDYLQECRLREILSVRIVHGKGKGVLRTRVHALLERLDYVTDYQLDWASRGSWGATRVQLKPLP
ncbi:Smr/MutS family protein [Spirochaeta dissipatitropha]